MLALSNTSRYFLYGSACDMRKSFEGLQGLVRNELGEDPMSGDLFLFINRRRNTLKILVWDETGFVIYHKRLEVGTFELPGAADNYQISKKQLMLMLEGVEISSVKERKRYYHPCRNTA